MVMLIPIFLSPSPRQTTPPSPPKRSSSFTPIPAPCLTITDTTNTLLASKQHNVNQVNVSTLKRISPRVAMRGKLRITIPKPPPQRLQRIQRIPMQARESFVINHPISQGQFGKEKKVMVVSPQSKMLEPCKMKSEMGLRGDVKKCSSFDGRKGGALKSCFKK